MGLNKPLGAKGSFPDSKNDLEVTVASVYLLHLEVTYVSTFNYYDSTVMPHTSLSDSLFSIR
jgi:hypothetical protein